MVRSSSEPVNSPGSGDGALLGRSFGAGQLLEVLVADEFEAGQFRSRVGAQFSSSAKNGSIRRYRRSKTPTLVELVFDVRREVPERDGARWVINFAAAMDATAKTERA